MEADHHNVINIDMLFHDDCHVCLHAYRLAQGLLAMHKTMSDSAEQ